MKTRSVLRRPSYTLMLAILVVASFLAGTASSKGQSVNAQRADIADYLAAPTGGHVCTIESIAIYGNRIQVRCPNYDGVIHLFASPFASAAESRQTNRLLAMLISAKAMNRQVVLYYSDNSASNPPGCLADDCRLLEGVVLQ